MSGLTILSIIMTAALIVSILITIRKRREEGADGIKSALTSICFYLITVTNLVAYWFDMLGLVSWSLTVILLIAGAYFTKYLPERKERNYGR
ncbi:hypothetical protein MJ3_02847 [Salimicrobium jeotgali]|uniref:Uncharacterized protein n=1 Tax=Salimicrobium jeotgali TaxID=1230341 RepID=K2GDI9_9BACI|nr:hypothetical protein [Salimicrobium jeotgali]EKE32342.1 hypothetical protein MJ3_02847 [Salimicrobium jeotgali]MBM7695683.1 CHASE2 domain-containing sensor protein [Salimicrobium jeotgali]